MSKVVHWFLNLAFKHSSRNNFRHQVSVNRPSLYKILFVTGFLKNYNFTSNVNVRNITINTHEATKYTRVFEMKSLLENQSFAGFSLRHSSIVDPKLSYQIIKIDSMIIKNAMKQSR